MLKLSLQLLLDDFLPLIAVFLLSCSVQIRPIDKKLQYQIQKLTRDSDTASEKSVISEKGTDTQKEDLLKYRPKPDMLVRKTSNTAEVGVWYMTMK